MSIPTLLIVGAIKGGVGKTTISRTLLDYYHSCNVDIRAVDTETPPVDSKPVGLKRFYSDRSEVIDLSKSAGQMRVFDSLKNHAVTLIDIRAGLLFDALTMLSDTGFFESGPAKKYNIIVIHILGGTISSYAEVSQMASIITNARHLLIRNHINDNSFFEWTREVSFTGEVIDIPKLNELAGEHVDASALTFNDFINDQSQSETMRGYVRHWLKRVFKTYDEARLNIL